ncbi:MAG: hypothetical protein HYZ53_15535 [Planctomycetes bacterium]|nr:hypothetical protein [Planctomycetota bacterium]
MEQPHSLEGFVSAYLEHRGCLVEPLEPGVQQVLGGGKAGSWPKEGELARLVFDPEAVTEYPDAVPVFFGTPRADDFLDEGKALAPVARGFRAELPVAVHDLAQRLGRSLHAPGFVIEVLPGRSRYDLLGLFLFRATFVGEEREEELYAAGVDLALGRAHRGIEGWAALGGIVSRRPRPLLDGPMMPLRKAQALAWQEVLPRVQAGRRTREEAARERVGLELGRLRDYFDESLRELEERRVEAAGAAGEWEEKRRVTVAERDRRVLELEGKQVLRVEATLASLLLVGVPRQVASFRLRTKTHVSADVEVLYDPASESVLPPDCPGCGRPTTEWCLAPPPPGGVGAGAREGRAVCPACHASKDPGHRRGTQL